MKQKSSLRPPPLNFADRERVASAELGHEDEHVIVARAARHDAEAFTWLYHRTVDKIYKYIYYRVGTKTQAEDLTGQVYLKAWAAMHRYRWTDRPFAAWLFRIAHNLVVDYFSTQHDAISIDAIPLIDGDDDVEEITQKQLTGETLRQAIKHLTEDQQQVIILKFLEGYTTDDLAAMMGKHSSAVRAIQYRGLVALKRVLRKDRLAL